MAVGPVPTPQPPSTTVAMTGYALPVQKALLTANPAWIGMQPATPTVAATPAAVTSAATPDHGASPTPATETALPVPAGTEVDAATTGILQVEPNGNLRIVGTDQASYFYSGVSQAIVTPAQPGGVEVTAGEKIGVAGAAGIDFAIYVPDLDGAVCANSALQAWMEGVAVDIRSLPATCTDGANATPAAANATTTISVVTDQPGTSYLSELQSQLTGTQVQDPSNVVLDTNAPIADQVAQIAAAQPTPANLLVIALAGSTPQEAAALTAKLPANQQILWIVPPQANTPSDVAAGYHNVLMKEANVRMETMAGALSVLDKPAPGAPAGTVTPWSDQLAKVLATMTTRYAGSAYRLPLVSLQVQSVLNYAEAQMGKPYLWAGAGPAAFDCSGLTMNAYATVGIQFTHNAYAQYEATKAEAVAQDALEPGDLVFFGPNEAGIHHVGIYVGNNQFIDAPETGTFVRIDTLGPGWDYFGATRPLAAGTTGAALTNLLDPSNAGATVAGGAAVGADQEFAQAVVSALWDPTQFGYLQELWNQESGWNVASENASSGAYGIPQALPGNKMASVGSDWQTDPYTQILWGLQYIQSRYGTPQAAWAHETSAGWY